MSQIMFIGLTKPKEQIQTIQTRCPITLDRVLIRTVNNQFQTCCFDKKDRICNECKLKPRKPQAPTKPKKRKNQTAFSQEAEQLTQKLAIISNNQPTLETWAK